MSVLCPRRTWRAGFAHVHSFARSNNSPVTVKDITERTRPIPDSCAAAKASYARCRIQLGRTIPSMKSLSLSASNGLRSILKFGGTAFVASL